MQHNNNKAQFCFQNIIDIVKQLCQSQNIVSHVTIRIPRSKLRGKRLGFQSRGANRDGKTYNGISPEKRFATNEVAGDRTGEEMTTYTVPQT